jgi:hypothetical protein
MAAAPCVYDQQVNTSTDHGETGRTDSAKSLTSFITADVPPCLRQAEFRVRSVLLGVSSYTHPVSASAMMGLR